MNITNALRSAIKAEISAQEMYKKMAEETDNPEVKSLFYHLAGYEQTHQQFLEAELRAIESAHNNKEGLPSHWLQLLTNNLQLSPDGNIVDNTEKIRISLTAAESVAKILKSANEELLKSQVRYENELAIAADIQKKLLTRKPPTDTDLDIAFINVMAREIGGDYYDFLKNDRDQLTMVIGDSMGKGMPAALLMTTVRAVWQSRAVSGFESPGDIMTAINRIVYPDLKATESFMTMFCALYEPKTSNFKYCNAGHNPPILHSGDNKNCVQLEIGGIPVGMFPDAEYHSDEFIMKKGDVIVMYTDGITEARNENDVEFGYDRLCDLINENYNKTSKEIADNILSAALQHTGNSSLSDDITIVVLKRDS
ncbi:MAG: SpoIIE family protein phosphatase [Candidatus Poribacteria bacterium]